MTKNELKKQLHQYIAIREEYKQIKDEMKKVEAGLDGLKSVAMDGMPRGSGKSDPVMQAVTLHLKLQNRYKQQLAKLAAAQTAIEDLIDGLDPVERKIFRHRYIDGLKWEEICVVDHYGWRQAHRIHSAALDKILAKYE